MTDVDTELTRLDAQFDNDDGDGSPRIEWSGLRFRYIFALTDGTRLEVTTGIPDVVRFERVHKRSFLKTDELTIEEIVWLGWCAAKRQKLTDQVFDQFMPTVEDYTQDAVNTDPTRPVP